MTQTVFAFETLQDTRQYCSADDPQKSLKSSPRNAHERAARIERACLERAAGQLTQAQFSAAFAELLARVHPTTADTMKETGVTEQCALNWRRGHNTARGNHAENVIFAHFDEWIEIRAKYARSA